MKMYRIAPVALPSTLAPGEYEIRDNDGRTLLSVALHHPMESQDLADLIDKHPPGATIGAVAA